jgi:hypothetical protein
MQEPWEIETEQIAANNGCPPELAQTFVILRWMYLGKLEPLMDSILKRQSLDQAVLNALAYMIADDDKVFTSASDPSDKYRSPFRLETKRRHGKAGRPAAPSKFIRQFLIEKDYRSLTKELGPRNSEKALEEVSKRRHVSISTVLKARSKYTNK